MSTHVPFTSNFHPWYTHLKPHSSLRPQKRLARRCGQNSSISPTRPFVSRNASKSSPNSRTRTGGQSRSGTSLGSSAGNQNRRKYFPACVPESVCVSSSSSSLESIYPSSSKLQSLVAEGAALL